MGLRCSVLGHRYGARGREEEREQDGDEVVVTVRDIKRCERCGNELVVSESKEVTAAPGADVSQQARGVEQRDDQGVTGSTEPPVEGNDGVILEEEDAGRDPGQWPDEPAAPSSADPAAEDEGDWPDVDVDADEGYDAATSDDPDDDSDDGAMIEAAPTEGGNHGAETETGFYKADEIEPPADPSEADVHSEYYCPQCSWQRESLEASVRAGDICPDCRKGYIAERNVS